MMEEEPNYEAKVNINEAGNRYPLLALIHSADNMVKHIQIVEYTFYYPLFN